MHDHSITYHETTLDYVKAFIHKTYCRAAPRPRTEFIHKIIRRRKTNAGAHRDTRLSILAPPAADDLHLTVTVHFVTVCVSLYAFRNHSHHQSMDP